MLITSDEYFKQLLKNKDNNIVFLTAAVDFANSGEINYDILKTLYEEELITNKVIDFYSFLIKKMHKVIKELLDDSPKSACSCIKIITCLITQATITLEKQFSSDDLIGANNFIECVGLKELSNALCTYFSTGDISDIEKQILRVRKDVEFVKYNIC